VYLYKFNAPAVLNPIQQSAAGAAISIEAEGADTRLAQGKHRWNLGTSSTASGGGQNMVTAAAINSADNGANRDTNFQTWNPTVDSPKLDYRVNFKETGTFYVWVRGLGPDDGNSVHVGIDGTPSTNAEKVQFGGSGTTSWMWVGTNRSGARATINVSATGPRTVNVWMREDGVSIDKIVLTKSSTFTPTGTGPAASTR
jgi:hypothetical protein